MRLVITFGLFLIAEAINPDEISVMDNIAFTILTIYAVILDFAENNKKK